MIKNIIFDWSGVIRDCLLNGLKITNEMFKEFGIKEILIEEYKENWEQPYMRFYNKYLPELTLEQENESYNRAHRKFPHTYAFDGIVDLINDWKLKGIKMVVVTSDNPETLLPEIESFGLRGAFVDVVTGAHDKKEEAERLINKNNFKREETIFIGDSNHEIEVGKELGIQTGAVTWGFCTEEKLTSLKPDFMIHNIDELKAIIE